MQKERTLIIDALKKVGEEITLYGWVQTVRSHGKIAFFDLRDGSGIIQVGGFGEEKAGQISALRTQAVVEVTGIIKKRDEKYINHSLPTGTIEVELSKINVMSVPEEMPFDMGGKTLDLQLPTLLDYRTLTLRHNQVQPIFKVQEAIVEGFRNVAKKLGCTEIFIPTISASATEGGAEVFPIDYYGHHAYLTQSPQLYKQMMIPVFERVYTIAHAYRAEPSVTTRHLSESTQLDCEFGFVDFEDLLNLIEEVAVDTLRHAETKCKEIFSQFGIESIRFGKIPRLTLREAQEIIYKEIGRDSRTEKDLAPQDEIDICKWALKTHDSDFVIITHFPTKKRSFYTMPDPKNPEYSLSYDLLFRGVEVLSGSSRIHEYTELVQAIKDRGMDPKNFKLYLQAFQYGMPPEGGFSFGLERLTMHMLNLANVREASLFPRDMERVDERFSSVQEDKKTQ